MLQISKEEFVTTCTRSESMRKAAIQLDLSFTTFRKYARQFGCYKPNMGLRGFHRPKESFPLEKILDGQHPSYQSGHLRRRLIEAGLKENKCETCGISSWNDQPICIELHHIDGASTNHRLENLMMVCPNCHSQTKTFRYKKRNKSGSSPAVGTMEE